MYGFVFEDNTVTGKSQASFSKWIPKVDTKTERKAGVYKFLRFEERFWKALFFMRD